MSRFRRFACTGAGAVLGVSIFVSPAAAWGCCSFSDLSNVVKSAVKDVASVGNAVINSTKDVVNATIDVTKEVTQGSIESTRDITKGAAEIATGDIKRGVIDTVKGATVDSPKATLGAVKEGAGDLTKGAVEDAKNLTIGPAKLGVDYLRAVACLIGACAKSDTSKLSPASQQKIVETTKAWNELTKVPGFGAKGSTIIQEGHSARFVIPVNATVKAVHGGANMSLIKSYEAPPREVNTARVVALWDKQVSNERKVETTKFSDKHPAGMKVIGTKSDAAKGTPTVKSDREIKEKKGVLLDKETPKSDRDIKEKKGVLLDKETPKSDRDIKEKKGVLSNPAGRTGATGAASKAATGAASKAATGAASKAAAGAASNAAASAAAKAAAGAASNVRH